MTTPKKCGIKRIDDLIEGVSGAKPIDEKENDPDAVGAVQDLLVGFNYCPDLLSLRNEDHRGKFDKLVKDYVKTRRKKWGIEPKDKVIVDRAFLLKLLDLSKPESDKERNPIASRIYLTRMLGFDFTPFLRCVWLTSMQETDGRFARASNRALNNIDQAGMSYGILQWTQKSDRLKVIMRRLKGRDERLLRQCFGGEVNTRKMIEHADLGPRALKPDGTSTVPELQFLDEPWRGRFIATGLKKAFQEEQVKQALDDFRDYYDSFQKMQEGNLPQIVSERGIALVLDMINQSGKTGFKRIYDRALPKAKDKDEKALRIEIRNDRDGDAKNTRRDFFLTTTQLSDGPFVP